ncbi:MAG: folate family ECF transporter S component [Clostridia bacterium]|nr:folate family ECF transporter S component [Clostridia bacterium]
MLSVLSFIRSQFADSLRALRRTSTVTTAGLLLAIQMVLSSYGVIEVTDSLKISLAHLALAPTAILFGPVAAALQGALSDVLGFLLKPTGPYFPGFTLTALLGGLIYGLFLYRTKHALWQIVLARLVIIVFVNICLNTVFLTMLYGPSRLATLPLRAFKNIIQLPIDCLLLSAVCRFVRRMPAAAHYR